MALTLGDNFSYQGAKPLDARLKYATLAAMKAVADSTMYDGCMAYCVATDKTYQWKSANEVDIDTGKWREYSSGQTIQVATLPTAGADELGNVYQYVGSTTSTLTHGYFYECVSDGESTPTYSWSQVEVSKGGHDIKNDGVAVTARDTMNFTDFDISDDSTNLETDIKAHRLTQAEMTDICSPLPSTPSDMPILFDETGAERIVGWYKLANGTKKPVYEKNLYLELSVSADTGVMSQNNLDVTLLNLDKVIGLNCFLDDTGFVRFTTDIWDKGSTSTEKAYGFEAFYDRANNGIKVCANRLSFDGKTATIVLRYTKSTDTPS